MTKRRLPAFGEPYTARLNTVRTAEAELDRYVASRVALGKVIGFEGMPGADKIEKRGEAWEKIHHQEILATNSLSQHLHQTIAALLPADNARVVIFIDDIDRCNPKAAPIS